jgi:hypothetical protein
MNRREALRVTASLLGSSIIGANAFLACTQKKESSLTFQPSDLSFLNEIAETILPTTADSLGAKTANIGEFMQTMVIDCYTEEEQNIFEAGLRDIESKSKSKSTFGRDFFSLSEKEKSMLLSGINQEAGDDHYFSMIKQLVVLGYFTSKIGVTQALRYEPIPGRYDGCVPYQQGEKAWAA